jgi:hypothetical protein
MVSKSFNSELNESLRLINYRRDLILSEQPKPQVMWGPTGFTTSYETKKYFETKEERRKFVHNVLDVAAIASLFFGPFGWAVGTAIEGLNVYLYLQEGDPYEFGLRVVFLFVPFDQLITKIPAVRRIGKKGLDILVEKILAKSKNFTRDEWEVITQFMNLTSPELKQLIKSGARYAMKVSFKKLFTETSIYGFVRFFMMMKKSFPKIYKGSEVVGKIAGIWWTYDQLAAKFGILPKEKMTDEQKKVSVNKVEEDFETQKKTILITEQQKYMKVYEQAMSEETQNEASKALEQLKEKRKIQTK